MKSENQKKNIENCQFLYLNFEIPAGLKRTV